MKIKVTKGSQPDYNLLSRKMLAGKATSKEMNELSRWNIVEAKMESLFKQMPTDETDEAVGRRMWNRIDRQCTVAPKRLWWTNRYYQMAIAACVTLLLIVGGIWMTQTDEATIVEEYMEIVAVENQQYLLPDSSSVWMKAGSSIRFARNFGKERRIWMKGESIFEVRKNGTPFFVNINEAFIEVKGTVFQVWNHSDGQSEVILFSGKVDFNTSSGQRIKMKPQQRIMYNPVKDDIVIEEVGNINLQNGMYKFTTIELGDLIRTLQDIYHTPIDVSAAVNQKHLFTGSINCGDSITRVIERICFNMGCKYKYENEKIIIY